MAGARHPNESGGSTWQQRPREFIFVTERLGLAPWRSDDLALIRGIFGDSVVTAFEGSDWPDERIRDRLDLEIAN